MLKISSNPMITLSITCVLILILMGSFIAVMDHMQHIQGQAIILNDLGRIRGGLQRVVKLKVGGVQYDQMVTEIEKNILDANRIIYQELDENEAAINNYERLVLTWNDLKDSLEDVDSLNHKKVLRLSEEIWVYSDQLVMEIQIYTERTVYNNKVLIFALFVYLTGSILIAFFVRRIVNKTLLNLAIRDPLTKCYNRNYFMEMLKELEELSLRYNEDYSLAILDIDDFKRINDTYGHEIGDEVLLELTRTINKSLRKSDILVRYGGEEFVILLPKTHYNDAEIVCEKIRCSISEDVELSKYQLTVSLGVSGRNKETNHQKSLIELADQALYNSKRNGKNQVTLTI